MYLLNVENGQEVGLQGKDSNRRCQTAELTPQIASILFPPEMIDEKQEEEEYYRAHVRYGLLEEGVLLLEFVSVGSKYVSGDSIEERKEYQLLPEQAEALRPHWERHLEHLHLEEKRQAAFAANQLDDASIRERREVCLEVHHLDRASVERARQELLQKLGLI